MEPNSRIISELGDAGGAIGIICGLLLICTYIFIRYLMERGKSRDAELAELNRQLQEALVANAEKMGEYSAAITQLVHIMQQRPCLSVDSDDVKETHIVTQCVKKRSKT